MEQGLEIRRILIVDDEPEIREILSHVMEKFNIGSDVAENGLVALEKLKNNVYHAVLSDIFMPVMSGLECLAKAQAEGINTPFVFITGFEDRERMLQAIRLGALDFIGKPFNNDIVTDVTTRAIEVGARRKQIYSEIKESNLNLYEKIKKDERIISLMRAHNNKKRVG